MAIVGKEPIAAIFIFVPSSPILDIAQMTLALSFSSSPSDAAIIQGTVHFVGSGRPKRRFDAPLENNTTEQQQAMTQSPCVFNDCAFTFQKARVAVKIITVRACKATYVVMLTNVNRGLRNSLYIKPRARRPPFTSLTGWRLPLQHIIAKPWTSINM